MGKTQTNKFWNFKNVSEKETELWLYGDIASQQSWWEDTVTPGYFKDELSNLTDVDTITVRINSGGGDVFAATAIYTLLKDHAAHINVKIDGLAASAATIVAMAGDTVYAPSNAMLMVHNPLLFMYGYFQADKLEKYKNTLNAVKEAILFSYESKTGMDRQELSDMMDKETWLTAEEAKNKGFVDEIMFNDDDMADSTITNNGRFVIVNSITHDLNKYKVRPTDALLNQTLLRQPVNIAKPKEEPIVEIKNVEDLRKAYPDFIKEIENSAQENERNRMKSIDEISASISPTLVNQAKYETVMSAQELAFEAIKVDAQQGTNFINARQNEVNAANVQQIQAGKDVDAATLETETAVDTIVNFMNGRRGVKNGQPN